MMRKLHVVVFNIIHLFSKRKAARYIGVKFGKNCRLITKHYGTEPWLIEIGNNVTITDGVKLITHDGSTCLARDNRGRRFKYGKILIGDNVFIGVNTIILPNITIGSNVVVGAGSVVTSSIEAGSIYAGNPARKIGNFSDLVNTYLKDCICEDDWDIKMNYKENIDVFLVRMDSKIN